MAQPTCSHCEQPVEIRGLCHMHYQRWRRGARLDAPVMPWRSPWTPDQILAGKFEKTDTCWNWTGYLDRAGYGVVNSRGLRIRQAYRLAYTAWVGPIPDGLHLDHLCRNPRCIRPDHLEPVTPAENARRAGPYRRPTHCKRGHLLSEDNVYRAPSRPQWRVCLTCIKAYRARHRAAR